MNSIRWERANIHDLIEQQTVSISKAGITPRLNVLAASYKVQKKLTSQLLSRFNLIFSILDKLNYKIDPLLAKYVTIMHKFNVHPKAKKDILSHEFIWSYIAEARKI